MFSAFHQSGDPQQNRNVVPIISGKGDRDLTAAFYLFNTAGGATSRIDLGSLVLSPPWTMRVKKMYAKAVIVDPAATASTQNGIFHFRMGIPPNVPQGTSTTLGTQFATATFDIYFLEGEQLDFSEAPLVFPANASTPNAMVIHGTSGGLIPAGYFGFVSLIMNFEYLR